jgi:hypothetical protein
MMDVRNNHEAWATHLLELRISELTYESIAAEEASNSLDRETSAQKKLITLMQENCHVHNSIW